MKLVHSSSLCLMLSAAAAFAACSGGDPATEASSPVVTIGGAGSPAGAGGATSGGAAAGGATTGGSGTVAGLAGGPGSLSGTVGTAGGTASGGPGGTPAGALTGGIINTKPMACEKKVRTAGKTVPDFMIVLDRSASMRTTIDPKINCTGVDPITAALLGPVECALVNCMAAEWMGTTACGGTMMTPGVDRWGPAVTALKALTEMFQTKVSFGLTTYPGMGGQGQGDPNCAAGNLRVPVGINTAGMIATTLNATQPGGYTPTAQTLQAVLQHIMMKKASPDAELPPQFVLLVTDGSPNCVGQSLDNDQQAHQATIQAIDALAMAGVKTYVIGYDASVDMRLASQLSQYAQRGGTNNFFAVQDAESLVAKFTEITGVVAECTYTLDMKPVDKKYVRVELDQKSLAVDTEDGWSIEEKTVTIKGKACSTLRDGSKSHTLAVTVECAPVIIN